MQNLNRYNIASLSLALLLTACGGGGGGGGGAGGGNNTAANAEVTVTNNLNGSTKQVVAGRTFTITAKLTQGSGSTVSFANGSTTPSSVKYAPASCDLTPANNSCTTTVTVGLTTAAVALSPGYTTNVSYSGSAAVQKVTFAVTTPALEVVTQPATNVAVGTATTAKLTLPSSSIPAGSGTINVALAATNSDIVTLDKSVCQIEYANSVIKSDTCSITVTGQNPGTTRILASSNHFTSVTTTPINVDEQALKPGIELNTSLNDTEATVVAGQSFTITATSVNNATSDVNFSNANSSLGTVTYAPATCHVAPSSPCTTKVTVGVATAVNAYQTNINYSGGSSLIDTHVNFLVTQPKLAVLTNPDSSITIGSNTKVGFTIENDMVPDETGSITLDLASTNGLVGFVTLAPNSCQITYDHKKITSNGCDNIAVTAGNQIGTTQIYATSSNFIQSTSNILEVTPGAAPTVEIDSSIQGNKNIIYSGQSFNLTLKSVNGSNGALTFSTTDPRVILDKTSCDLTAGGSCVIKVSAPLNLTGYHGVKVNYVGGLVGQYNFNVNAPQLQFIRYANVNVGSILKGNDFSVTFTITDGEVPDGNGQIAVNLAANPSDIFTVRQPSCTITYANNAITNNGCDKISVNAANYGVAKVTANADNFISADSNSTIVPKSITYVLGSNLIKSLANTGNGKLLLIDNPNQVTVPDGGGFARKMTLNTISSNSYIYVQKLSAKEIFQYNISKYSGLPEYATSFKTKEYPTSIVFSPSKSTAYILEDFDVSIIAQYSLAADGTVQKLADNIDTLFDSLMAINPVTGTVYVSGTKFSGVFNQFTDRKINVYQPGTVGKLVLQESLDNEKCPLRGISVAPDGKTLVVACTDKIISYALKNDGSINNSSEQTSQYPSGTKFTNVYFAPDKFVQAKDTVIAYAGNGKDLYKLSFQGDSKPLSGWNNSILTTGYEYPQFVMAFTGLGNGGQVYLGSIITSNIQIYKQDIYNGNLTLDTQLGSNGLVDAGVPVQDIVVGPNL